MQVFPDAPDVGGGTLNTGRVPCASGGWASRAYIIGNGFFGTKMVRRIQGLGFGGGCYYSYPSGF